MEYQLQSYRREGNGCQYTLVVEHQPGFLERLVGVRQSVAEYRGRGKVWFQMPNFTPCTPKLEAALTALFETINHRSVQIPTWEETEGRRRSSA
ncbi:hypothetical protein HYU19_03085 [Candidatus Woesearchaeota archaeon]|nr:hypothetical protein [Candidatus Woesearchaeota archaeon]